MTAAQRDLAAGHVPFAAWVLDKWFPRLRAADYDDALAASMLGIVLAAARFDPARGRTFRTYAAYWCRQCVFRWLAKSRRRGFRPHGRPVRLASLDLAADGNGATVGHFLIAPEQDPDIGPDAATITAAFARLQPREAEALRLLYGQQLGPGQTAKRMGISRTRVGELQRKGVAKLREMFDRGRELAGPEM